MNQIVVEDTHIWSDVESDWSETGRRYVELVEWSDTARRSDRLVGDWSDGEEADWHCYDVYVYVETSAASAHLVVIP